MWVHLLNTRITQIGILLFIASPSFFAQTMTYPKEIRGYKVERAAVDLKPDKNKKQKSAAQKTASDRATQTKSGEQQTGTGEPPQLIQFGSPRVARVTPLGISLEIPVVVSPVRQKGRVDFLVFEKMVVNGTSVQIDEYHRAFDLPNDKPLTLKEPLRFFVYLPSAIVAAIDELGGGSKEWPITGVVYIFGRFKKSVFRFKRVVPVELSLTVPNPLRSV
jgi:hypothetical protein